MAEERQVRDGSVSVFQGRVIVTDESGGGQRAVLEPGPGLKLYVNEIEVTGPREVSSKDKIRIELQSKPGQAEVKVNISADGLTAEARLDLIPETRFYLEDSVPRQHLILLTRPGKSCTCRRWKPGR